MIIEFRLAPGELADWLAHDEATWSRFLERQQGFVSKAKAIPQTDLDAVNQERGPWVRDPTCRTFDVVRDS